MGGKSRGGRAPWERIRQLHEEIAVPLSCRQPCPPMHSIGDSQPLEFDELRWIGLHSHLPRCDVGFSLESH